MSKHNQAKPSVFQQGGGQVHIICSSKPGFGEKSELATWSEISISPSYEPILYVMQTLSDRHKFDLSQLNFLNEYREDCNYLYVI